MSAYSSFSCRALLLPVVVMLLPATASYAHHSLAPYDIRNAIEVTGVADNFVFRRPHPMLRLIDEEGVSWIIEVPLRHWQRSGVAEDAIEEGDELKVLIFPARNGDPEGAMSGFTKDGEFHSVAARIGQKEGNAAADAIERGEPLEEVLEKYKKPDGPSTPRD